WCTPEPAQRPWELALPERAPVPVQIAWALADLTPAGRPAQGDHPLAPRPAPACAAAPCPAVHAVRRPATAAPPPPQSRRPRGRRPAASRRPAPPVPPQQRVSDYAPPVLAEPERLPAEPERLMASP